MQYCGIDSIMPVRRNFARQGKASAKPDGVVTFVVRRQADAFTPYCGIDSIMLVRRNFARQGKASAKPDGVVTYVEGDKPML